MEKKERRSSSRFNVEPLLCKMIPGKNGFCVLRNVSINGAFFLNHAPPPVGDKVKLEFSEKPLEGYRIIGEVVRHGMGRLKGFAVHFPMARPRLLRAFYHSNF